VTVLATGREGLGVWGERMMMVRSLPMPGEGATTDEILAADAVQLFTDRAERAGGALDLDADTAATVAQLCRRLDGIPLAIELAAARTRMMSPQEIAARLDEPFRLLTGGSRTAVERHQTLQLAVDWSYDLLAERERTILDRLGVFAGGFTLDAAEAVVGDDDLDRLEVLDGITQLVDKSLVVAEREHHDTRYRLLETIRTYALERLADHGATDTMRRQHATWCARFLAAVSAGVRGPDEAMWLQRINREVDNVRAALTWATGADDANLSLELIGDFGVLDLLSRRVGYLLGPWAGAALATSDATEHPLFARVLAVRALDHLNHTWFADAERDARRAIDIAAGSNSPFDDRPWSVLCVTLVEAGRASEVEGVDSFLEAARATGDDYTVASALSIVALLWYVLDDAERCRPIAEEAMEIAQRIAAPSLLANTGAWLGVALTTIDLPRARSTLESALEHAIAVEILNLVGMCSVFLGRLGADITQPQWAQQFRESLDLHDAAGDTPMTLMHLDLYAQTLAPTDRAEAAAMLAAAVAALSPHMLNPISVAHRRTTNERLLTRLGEERLTDLTAQGATFGYEEAVALARAELDRVIARDDPA
jgi:hypothetical protein